MPEQVLKPQALTQEAFHPFGAVIEKAGSRTITINEGWATRHHDLAPVDVTEAGGRPLINIFHGKARPLPLEVTMMERHPLSSQAFVPLSPRPFLVLVAPPGEEVDPNDLRAFVSSDQQGVSYARGVWHHPLIAIDEDCDFLVVDRGAADENCDLFHFDRHKVQILLDH